MIYLFFFFYALGLIVSLQVLITFALIISLLVTSQTEFDVIDGWRTMKQDMIHQEEAMHADRRKIFNRLAWAEKEE
jgi:hypothetical protein